MKHHHQQQDHRHQTHQQSDKHDHQRSLDLDAEVFCDHLATVLDLAGVTHARSVVDIGAGTGTGSRLLRQRYPDAVITCIDNDPEMLDLLRKQGFAVIEADLKDGFPSPTGLSTAEGDGGGGSLDLVWASSSLHHVTDPSRLLSGVRLALPPAGTLVVVELTGFPCFLSNPSEVLLEQRCHAAAAAQGWNDYPDWTPVLQAAGFVVTSFEVPTAAPVTPAARDYAEQWFRRFLHLPGLTASDRDAMDEVLQRSDDIELEPRATRTVWVAVTTQHKEHS